MMENSGGSPGWEKVVKGSGRDGAAEAVSGRRSGGGYSCGFENGVRDEGSAHWKERRGGNTNEFREHNRKVKARHIDVEEEVI